MVLRKVCVDVIESRHQPNPKLLASAPHLTKASSLVSTMTYLRYSARQLRQILV